METLEMLENLPSEKHLQNKRYQDFLFCTQLIFYVDANLVGKTFSLISLKTQEPNASNQLSE